MVNVIILPINAAMVLATSNVAQAYKSNLIDYASEERSDDPAEDEEMDGNSSPNSCARTVVPGAEFDIDAFKKWMATDQGTLQTVGSREEELQQRILELETLLDIDKSVDDLKLTSLLAQSTGREIQMMRLEHQNDDLKRYLERSMKRVMENFTSTVKKACENVVTAARELGKFSEPDMVRLIVKAQDTLAEASKGLGDSIEQIKHENRNTALSMYVRKKTRVKSPKKKRAGRK